LLVRAGKVRSGATPAERVSRNARLLWVEPGGFVVVTPTAAPAHPGVQSGWGEPPGGEGGGSPARVTASYRRELRAGTLAEGGARRFRDELRTALSEVTCQPAMVRARENPPPAVLGRPPKIVEKSRAMVIRSTNGATYAPLDRLQRDRGGT